MKIKTKPVREYKSTPTDSMPEGTGWEYDGHDYCLGTGEENYFWSRVVPNKFIDTVYTLKRKKPKGDWKPNGLRRVGPTNQRRFYWTRTYVTT